MNKKFYLITAIAFLAVQILFFVLFGRQSTIVYTIGGPNAVPSNYTPEVQHGDGIVVIDRTYVRGNNVIVEIHGVSRGRAEIYLTDPTREAGMLTPVTVHVMNIVTTNGFFGEIRGGIIIPILATVYMILVLVGMIRKYRRDVAAGMYRYVNVMDLGVIIFLSFLILNQIFFIISYRSIELMSLSILSSGRAFASVLLPIAFIVSIYITASNLVLMKREGRNWRNMLGAILGAVILIGTLVPDILSAWLQRTTLVDVHNENGMWLYIERFVESGIGITVAYLESVLLATIWFGFKSARHIPAFDKDYILILGCQINDDGTLTNLLRQRTDRAVEFARMQEEATGKKVTFVPSGGQGDDEVMPEAQAIHDYLVGIGIPEERILVEDQSVNTYENLNNSMKLIRKDFAARQEENASDDAASDAQEPNNSSDAQEPKVAFSTTNYHVFRSGLLGTGMGLKLEGIGSQTKRYFWINAFVREYIATLHSERKVHTQIILALYLLTAMLVGFTYLAVVLY